MRKNDFLFIVAVIAVAVFVGATALSRAGEVLSAVHESSPSVGAAGQPRDVDEGRIRNLIDGRHLSGHEADFYTRTLPSGR